MEEVKWGTGGYFTHFVSISKTIRIMDGFCIAQILPSRKLNALAHTIHSNILADINIF